MKIPLNNRDTLLLKMELFFKGISPRANHIFSMFFQQWDGERWKRMSVNTANTFVVALAEDMHIFFTWLLLPSLLMTCHFIAVLPWAKISNQGMIIIRVNIMKVENTVNSCWWICYITAIAFFQEKKPSTKENPDFQGLISPFGAGPNHVTAFI